MRSPIRTMHALGFVVAALSLAPSTVHAERVTILAVRGDDAGDAFRERAEAWARARGREIVTPAELAADRAPDATPADLAALGAIEARLARAGELAALLEEPAALRELAAARGEAERLVGMVGIAPWLAEIEVRIGIVAAQSGHAELARAAFRRAFALDPSRRVRSAELAPDGVALFEEAARAVELGPRGGLDVACDAGGARVTLDDRDLGACPAHVEASLGQHVLRVTAPGRLPFARLVDVHEGSRGALALALPPSPRALAAEALDRALADDDATAAGAALEALARTGADVELVWVAVGHSPRHRAAFVLCDVAGCTEPLTLEGDESPGAEPPRRAATPDVGPLAPWLDEPAESRVRRPRRRWILVGTAGVALVASAVAIGLAARPTEERLRVVVDFGPLAPPP